MQHIQHAISYVQQVLSIDMSDAFFNANLQEGCIKIKAQAPLGAAVLLRFRGNGEEAWIQKIWNIDVNQTPYTIPKAMLYNYDSIEIEIIGYQHRIFLKTVIQL